MVDPAIVKFLAAIEETQFLTPDRMQAYQRRLLDRLLRHARSETAFYADRLAPVFRADDSIDWDRWTEIPILTRGQAQENADALFARTTPAVTGKTLTSLTSGSTGRPLRHGKSALQNVASACANERFLRWHKLDPRALVGLLSFAPGEALYPDGETAPQWRVAEEDSPCATLNIDTPLFQQIEWLRRVRPAILASFPSNLREIGRMAAEEGAPLSFDAVLTYGEAVTPALSAAIRAGFGRAPLDQYGATEVGHIAATCPHSGKLHVTADLVRVEIVGDDDRPAPPGVPGRILVTSFYNYATPFIRYDIGDIGVLAGEPCGCGRTLPVLESVLGRSRNVFHYSDGTSALPHLESEDVQPFVAHRQFQVVQTAVDRIEYRYVPVDADQHNDLAGLSAYVRKHLHPTMTVAAVAVDSVSRSPSGKFEDYVSLVDPTSA